MQQRLSSPPPSQARKNQALFPQSAKGCCIAAANQDNSDLHIFLIAIKLLRNLSVV
jgi:hypothetical protein